MLSHEKILLFLLWFGVFWNRAGYSIIAPFFPILAHQKGLSTSEFSFVFGTFAFSELLFGSFIGKYLSGIDIKFLLLSSTFFTGGANILFGLMEYSPKGQIFLILCCLIRFVEGGGFIIFFITVITLIVKLFPTRPGFYVGLTGMTSTAGFAFGVPIGSFFQLTCGYFATFAIIGCLILLACVLLFTFFKEDTGSDSCEKKDVNPLTFQDYFRLLTSVKGLPFAPTLLAMTTGFTYVLINLSDHLETLNLSHVGKAGIYVLLATSFGLSSPTGGMIADRIEAKLLLQSFSALIVATGYLLIGPASFIPFERSVTSVIFGLMCIGCGNGISHSTSFATTLTGAREIGFPDGMRTYSLISSILSFCLTFGEFLGSLISGIFGKALTLAMMGTIFLGINIILAILTTTLYMYELCTVENMWLKEYLKKYVKSTNEKYISLLASEDM